MNTLYVTYCSGKKDKSEGSIPAIERYKSGRIRWVYNVSIKDRVDFAILSGLLGLVKPNKKIPHYDHKMNGEDIERITKLIKRFLRENEKYGKIVYFTKNPHGEPVLRYYHASLWQAKEELNRKEGKNIGLEVKLIQKISYEEIEIPNPERLFEDDKSGI